MSDLVRVKLESGAEVTVSREVAAIHQLKVLDSPAVDNRGVALDATPVSGVAVAIADTRTPAQKAAATRAEKKAQAEARDQAQAEADAANAAATQDPSSPTGEGASTEETR